MEWFTVGRVAQKGLERWDWMREGAGGQRGVEGWTQEGFGAEGSEAEHVIFLPLCASSRGAGFDNMTQRGKKES